MKRVLEDPQLIVAEARAVGNPARLGSPGFCPTGPSAGCKQVVAVHLEHPAGVKRACCRDGVSIISQRFLLPSGTTHLHVSFAVREEVGDAVQVKESGSMWSTRGLTSTIRIWQPTSSMACELHIPY
ncbi:hypothetical protein JQC72_14170 [Polycladomyces sp. WAk]|uniref:Uncharacterized protein n=1 Tax=Polycladomyces zharkentensis TaxID=2807616 RepID=A0ABS2WM78_9BACL|nr:hypothetical protein [Polycladomyces sp. WAk]MBN2910645.1 hypothetical protein [Polycladomyces sp. WAk]